jgi:hypothetical protein
MVTYMRHWIVKPQRLPCSLNLQKWRKQYHMHRNRETTLRMHSRSGESRIYHQHRWFVLWFVSRSPLEKTTYRSVTIGYKSHMSFSPAQDSTCDFKRKHCTSSWGHDRSIPYVSKGTEEEASWSHSFSSCRIRSVLVLNLNLLSPRR